MVYNSLSKLSRKLEEEKPVYSLFWLFILFLVVVMVAQKGKLEHCWCFLKHKKIPFDLRRLRR